jgi:hypothetical protein
MFSLSSTPAILLLIANNAFHAMVMVQSICKQLKRGEGTCRGRRAGGSGELKERPFTQAPARRYFPTGTSFII